MYNWSVDEKAMKKADPEGYKIWRITQTINFGEPREKLKEAEVRKYWKQIKDSLNPSYRDLIEFLLWPRRSKYLSERRKFLSKVSRFYR